MRRMLNRTLPLADPEAGLPPKRPHRPKGLSGMVDYAFYRASYAGKLISTDTDWMAAETAARIWLETQMALPQDPDPRVKMAICAAAEILYARKQRTPGVTAENTDGYSITYGESDSIQQELIQVVSPYVGDQVKSVRWC